MATVRIPSKLKARLNKEHATIIDHNLIDFSHILKEDKLFFFPEYTDHGINHIEGVLKSIEELISDDTFKKLSSLDVCAIIIATVLHDIGMHTSPEMFKNMIMGEYNHIPGNLFIEKTWKELWTEYLKDSRYWNQEKKDNVFGEKDYIIKEPNIDDLQSFNEYDKKFIGEFIRIHHARLAYEIALKGFIGKEPITFDFAKNHDLNNEKFIQVAGLVARSHGMSIRDTFDYLKPYGKDLWKKPLDIKVVFLMTLIRLADYIQIDASRTDELTLKLRVFYSQYSLREHKTHLAIDYVHFDNDDKEKIVVEASPKDAQMYVKINNLVQDIQKELDLSWAILGEVYGNVFKLRYRRVESNLTDEEVKNGYDFVPNQFGLRYNNKLTELLIEPLYGNNPSFGVRELVQNAVDACRTRMVLDKDYNNLIDFTHITVSLNPENELIRIEDTGIGMTIEEIENYFLTIGSSYDSNIDWQRARDEMNMESDKNMAIGNKIYRTGHFGIGILAAFLIGPKIKVKTKSIKRQPSEKGYEFTLSLGQTFIQINKVDLLNYGTTIEVTCSDEALTKLCSQVVLNQRWNTGTRKWFGWYIDSKPKVEYNYQGETIQLDSKWTKCYKPLSTKSDFGTIFWRPILLFQSSFYSKFSTLNDKHKLFCNGFTITDKSHKSNFLFPGLINYIPHGIPDIMVTDVFNQLPLNLQRLNIDGDVQYAFEEELAIALCKDFLCQMLALDIQSFYFSEILFFHASGFIINRYGHSYSYHGNDRYFRYPDKCLNRKTLVHIYFINKSHSLPHAWKSFIAKHPEAFFSFKHREYGYEYIPNKIISNEGEKIRLLNFGCVIYDSRLDDNKYNPFKKSIKYMSKNKDVEDKVSYIVSNDYLNYSNLVKDLVSFFNSLPSSSEQPYYCLIYDIENEDIPLSHLDAFIHDYASGDLIVPYDENDRRKKFSKLYEECGDEIERYRKIYSKLNTRNQ